MKLFGYADRRDRKVMNGRIVLCSSVKFHTMPVYTITDAEVETLKSLEDGTARILTTTKAD